MKKFIYLVKGIFKRAKGYFIVTFFQNIMGAIVPLIDILGIGLVVDRLTKGDSIKEILPFILIYVLANLFVLTVKNILQLAENKLMRKSTNILQCGYITDCLNVDYHFVQNRTLLDLKPKSMSARPEFFLGLWGRSLGSLVQIITTGAIMTTINGWFLLIIVILSAGVIISNVCKNKKEIVYHQKKMERDRKLDYLFTTMTDYKYAKEVRINEADELLIEKYDNEVAEQKKQTNSLTQKAIGIEFVGKFIMGVQLFAVYAFFTYEVFCEKNTIAEYVVLIPAVTLAINAVVELFTNIGYMKNNFIAVDFLMQYEQMVRDNSTVYDSEKLVSPKVDYINGDIVFEHVYFTYPDSEDVILQDVSFTVKTGTKCAIVGLNGAGKSTLISLLLRLYKPTSGIIRIDGVDINTIPYSEYISKFGVVLQDFVLFAYSIRENITFDAEYDEKRIKKVLSDSGLIKVVNDLEYGTDTSLFKDLDDNGIELSGGNGQRLALARALYKASNIAIFDEPTSAFDPLAEYDFFKQLGSLSAGKSTILISHRLSSTIFCDNIVVLSNGIIKEQGNHKELMDKAGEYYCLYNLQAQFYEKGKEYEKV